MSDREEFEKWKKDHSMNLEITIRDSNGDYQYIETRRDWYVWQNAIATRQPEIDALKLKIESDKREWQTVVAAFDSELKRVRAENERLRKDAHGHVEFIKAKAHHLPIEDQHVLAVMLDAAMQEGK